MNLRSLVPFRDRAPPARPHASIFSTLQREIDRLFDEFARGSGERGDANLVPSIDVVETDKEIEISAELPGLERKDVEISLEDNTLTIRGEKKLTTDKKDKNAHIAERSFGVFYRVLELPAGVDPSSIQATMSSGVLTIKIPKPPSSQTKRIEIKEAA
jgi:HSP20 family protein